MSDYEKALVELVNLKSAATRVVSRLHMTHRHATADTPALLAYGRRVSDGVVKEAEDAAVEAAVRSLYPNASKRHDAQDEIHGGQLWGVARWELHPVNELAAVGGSGTYLREAKAK